MAIAILLSVTVSIADDKSGMFIAIDWVTCVRVSAVDGNTTEAPGTNRTSSKVSASRICMNSTPAIHHLARPYLMDLLSPKEQI